MKISILGNGNFGFTILKHLSAKFRNNPEIKLFAYDRDEKLINHLQKTKKHLYLHKNVKIIKDVNFTNNQKEIFQDADIIVLATISSVLLKEILKNIKYINKPTIFLNLAKALEYKSGKPFSQIIEKIPEFKKNKCIFAVLNGGTIAKDLFHHEPLGVDIACKNKKAATLLKKTFTSDNLNIYTTSDVIGVEYAGAFKNVISILAGIINGLGFSYGSETHFITRAAHEITQLLKQSIKIDSYTFSMYSQCWGNDLWMSCTGNTRNKAFGILIGKGMTAKKALTLMKSQHKSVEGINTINALKKLNINNHYPILKSLQSIIHYNANPRKTIWKLMKSNNI